MKRNNGFDLLRIFLCICVIVAHSLSYFGIENRNIIIATKCFVLQANAVFFMLSGYFNLAKEFKDESDIKKYYKNKILNTLIPFLAFVFVWCLWEYAHVTESFNVFELLKQFYESFVNSSCDTHMWFMYQLFGLLLSTPFLSKMLHNMNDKELTIIWYIGLGWNFISIYLCYDLGINFRFSSWVLEGWPLYYFAGHYYRRVVSNQKQSKWYLLGIIGYFVTVIGELFVDNFQSSTNYQVMYTLFCMGILMFWDKIPCIKKEISKKIILFLSHNTFFIYLFHMRAIEFINNRLNSSTNNLFVGIIVVVLSFMSSLLASIIANLCLKPIQKFIDKKWIIK